jgi:hypothetical protein
VASSDENADLPEPPAAIHWLGPWRQFDQLDKEHYFLNELRWEIQANPSHRLYGKELWIAGWIAGYDDFILYLPLEDCYAYVHLTWNKESNPAFPDCQWFDDVDEVNELIGRWIAEAR